MLDGFKSRGNSSRSCSFAGIVPLVHQKGIWMVCRFVVFLLLH